MTLTRERIVRGLERELKELDPALLSLDDAVQMVRFFARVERLAAAGKAICANRCAEGGVQRQTGDRTAADWLAGLTGETVSQAISALEAGRGASRSGKLDEALRGGELSQQKSGQLGQLAMVDADKADDLVEGSKSSTAAEVRRWVEQAKQARSTEQSEQERLESIRKRRYLRFFNDPDGAGRIDGRFVPHEFALMKTAIEAVRERLYREARRDGRQEPYPALLADALSEIVRGLWTPAAESLDRDDRSGPEAPGDGRASQGDPQDGRQTASAAGIPSAGAGPTDPPRRRPMSPPRALVRFLVDWEAFFRGEIRDGESCEIPGVGQVPIAVARSVLGDAVCELVIKRGVDVLSVTRLGRYIPVALRRALDERDRRCVVPGCEMTRGLQAHHYRIDYHQFGPTELANLANICVPHHQMATTGGFRLRGRPGRWRWIPPGKPDPHDTEPDEECQAGDRRAGEHAPAGSGVGADPLTLFEVAS